MSEKFDFDKEFSDAFRSVMKGDFELPLYSQGVNLAIDKKLSDEKIELKENASWLDVRDVLFSLGDQVLAYQAQSYGAVSIKNLMK